MKKTSKMIPIRTSYLVVFKSISNTKVGLLLKFMIQYASNSDTPLYDTVLKSAFNDIKTQFDADLQRQERLAERSRRNGAKSGYRPKKSKPSRVINEDPRRAVDREPTRLTPKVIQNEEPVAFIGVSLTEEEQLVFNKILECFNTIPNKNEVIISQAVKDNVYDIFDEQYSVDDFAEVVENVIADEDLKANNYEEVSLLWITNLTQIHKYYWES